MKKNKIKQKSSRRLLIGAPMMILSIIIVIIVVPMILMMGGELLDITRSAVKMNPNIDDGYLIAEFEDPTDDLLRVVPAGRIYQGAAKALDICRFSVKKVKFSPLSGVGIVPRMNLVFEFNGELPNPHDSEHKFSLPVIHVYIDAPDKSFEKKMSERVTNVSFAEDEWDYQVIVDGMHEQALIFDSGGNLLGKSLGIYLNYEWEKVTAADGKTESQVKNTRITVGLPMKILGDPSKGEWSYYVVVGLADFRNSSMMLSSESETEPQIFDAVEPEDAQPIEIEPGARIKLLPLKIKN